MPGFLVSLIDRWRVRRSDPDGDDAGRGESGVDGIPEPLWCAVLARYPFIARDHAVVHADAARLRELAAAFLAAKEFHGAQDFVITDEVALCIAVQAVLPLLQVTRHRTARAALGWYDDFVGVVVHEGEVVARRVQADDAGVVHAWDEVLAGEAMDGGPVMVNWQDVAGAGTTAEAGYNVVIHEFVHKIDLADGQADGCPPMAPTARKRWLEAMDAAFADFRERVIRAERFGAEPTWLDPYGATSIDEFFAVAAEAFFVNRRRFETEFPALHGLYNGYFGSPAASRR